MAVNNTIPTIYGQPCPHCGSRDLRVFRTKAGKRGTFNARELWALSAEEVQALHSAAFVESLNPITYKCLGCKQKFTSLPVSAPDSELLAEPCTITFERIPKFVGTYNAQVPYINGICVEVIRREGTVTIKSPLKHNTVFVTDESLRGFKGIWSFEALPGENIHISFKRPQFEGTKGGTQAPYGYSAYSDPSALEQAQALANETVELRKIPLSKRIISVALIIIIMLAMAVPAIVLKQQRRTSGTRYGAGIAQQQLEQLDATHTQQLLEQLEGFQLRPE